MLGASFFSTLAGVYLPGEHCLLHGVECKFAKPIFIGDTLTSGHGCRRQRDRQRGRDQGRYHEPGRQARDPRHHQGRVSEITRRKIMSYTYLITGATSDVGRALIERLLQNAPADTLVLAQGCGDLEKAG